MKSVKKILIIIIAFVIVAAAVFVGLKIYKSDSKQPITPPVLTEVIGISELSTGEFLYNGVVSIPEENKPEKIAFSIKYNSDVKAGIDTDDISFEIDTENKTIKPILPEIVINNIHIDEGSIETLPEDTQIYLKDAISICEADAKEEANANGYLMEIAQSNLRDTISALLLPIAKDNGYTVIWE